MKPTITVRASAEDQTELDRLEIEHIARARSEGVRLVNLSNGGGGRAGYTPTMEEREKQRLSNLGKPHPKHTEAWKKMMSEKMRGRNSNTMAHMKRLAAMKRGVPRSQEVRDKISESRKGQGTGKRPEWWCKRISEGHTGVPGLRGQDSPRFRSDIRTEKILSRLRAGATKVQVARELGVPPTFVHRRLKAAGVARKVA